MKSKVLLASMICMFMLLTTVACTSNSHTNTNSQLSQQGESVVQDDSGLTSSTSSEMSSEQYPHTKALLEQPARFKSYEVEMKEQHSGGFPIPLPIDIELPIPGLQPGDSNQQPGVPDQLPGMPGRAEPQQPEVPNQSPEQSPDVNASVMAREARVVELTNIERRRYGLSDLQADPSLSNVAREKSNDMRRNNYFSHTSPTYGSPFDMMRDMGVSYSVAGENIAVGQQTPEEVVQAWMNSAGHRENILRRDFTHIGVGYTPQGSYWTQMFISK